MAAKKVVLFSQICMAPLQDSNVHQPKTNNFIIKLFVQPINSLRTGGCEKLVHMHMYNLYILLILPLAHFTFRLTFFIQAHHVGHLIGVGGQNIKRISQESGVRLNVGARTFDR